MALLGLDPCHMLQDTREPEVQEPAGTVPSSAAEQRPPTRLPLIVTPWCRGAEIKPSTVTSSLLEGSAQPWGASGVHRQLIVLISYLFFQG